MTKILSIGNSFSQDATAYLHDMAVCSNIDTKVANLYIGGCSLQTHWENVVNDAVDYEYEVNGAATGKMVSIRDTLLEDNWDFITLQQVSGDSGFIDSYYPYITNLSAYLKDLSPEATQLIHQTWAYEIDSTHEDFKRYQYNQGIMYQSLTSAYHKVSQDLRLQIIPSGDVIQSLRGLDNFDSTQSGISLCRDGFHMHLIYGRYAVAATWYECILNGNILENDFIPVSQDDKTNNKLIRLIKNTVHNICKEYKTRGRIL